MANEEDNQEQQEAGPNVSVHVQYLKDLSFESPKAPEGISQLSQNPEINVSLDIQVQAMEEENNYEVALEIGATAESQGESIFVVELTYGGIFELKNIPDEQRNMVLAIHCPSILFPYARKIISDATQEGGFQPLMLDPVDFGALYQKKMAEQEQEEQNSGGENNQTLN